MQKVRLIQQTVAMNNGKRPVHAGENSGQLKNTSLIVASLLLVHADENGEIMGGVI